MTILYVVRLQCDHVLHYEVGPRVKDILHCLRCDRAQVIAEISRNGKVKVNRNVAAG